ncbi:MAG: hypothetical protein JRJ39_00025 [Deltaproteobacteria bacterium]|nr:hypothetical protein [Deltaproteobacteria bacterium]
MTSDGNGKWQLAFWLVNVVCGIWLLGLTSGVVANDIRYVKVHTDIRKEAKQDKEDIMKQLQKIIRELGEIKGKLAK